VPEQGRGSSRHRRSFDEINGRAAIVVPDNVRFEGGASGHIKADFRRSTMWAQMIKTRVKPGQEEAVRQLPQKMQSRFGSFQAGRGPARVLVMQDENDSGAYITIVFFESEAKAREYEGSPEQKEIQQRRMQVWDGPPEFTDLDVTYEMNR
jgi:heme-degrading monooxygenase HmoA